MTYHETVKTLYTLLEQSRFAGENAWQAPRDTESGDGYAAKPRQAIERIAGRTILHHYRVTGEVYLPLANRTKYPV